MHMSYLTKVQTSDTVPTLVDRWAEETQPHHIWHNQ